MHPQVTRVANFFLLKVGSRINKYWEPLIYWTDIEWRKGRVEAETHQRDTKRMFIDSVIGKHHVYKNNSKLRQAVVISVWLCRWSYWRIVFIGAKHFIFACSNHTYSSYEILLKSNAYSHSTVPQKWHLYNCAQQYLNKLVLYHAGTTVPSEWWSEHLEVIRIKRLKGKHNKNCLLKCWTSFLSVFGFIDPRLLLFF